MYTRQVKISGFGNFYERILAFEAGSRIQWLQREGELRLGAKGVYS